jgi:hypothetical protein
MNRSKKEILHCDAERIGLVFPVHIWGLPTPVIGFIDRLSSSRQYILPRLLMPVRLLQHYTIGKTSPDKRSSLAVGSPLTCQAIIYPGVGLSRRKAEDKVYCALKMQEHRDHSQ